MNFIIEYWLEFLFGIIIAALGYVCKNYRRLYLQEKKHQKTKEQKEFYNKLIKVIQESYKLSQKDDEKLQTQIDHMRLCLDVVKSGILNLQGKTFKQECRKALEEEENISIEEFERIQADHDVYNGLGGNHDGDNLFALVEHKYKNKLQ